MENVVIAIKRCQRHEWRKKKTKQVVNHHQVSFVLLYSFCNFPPSLFSQEPVSVSHVEPN